LPPASFSETLVTMYKTSRRHITEAINLYNYRHVNLKSQSNCASNVSVKVYDRPLLRGVAQLDLF